MSIGPLQDFAHTGFKLPLQVVRERNRPKTNDRVQLALRLGERDGGRTIHDGSREPDDQIGRKERNVAGNGEIGRASCRERV